MSAMDRRHFVAVDECDAEEQCSGTAGVACPANGFSPAATAVVIYAASIVLSAASVSLAVAVAR